MLPLHASDQAKVSSCAPLEQDVRLSRHLYHAMGSGVPHSLLMALEHSGNGLIWIPAAVLCVLFPNVHWHLRLFAANLLVGFILDLICVGIVKVAVRRSRPSFAGPTGEYQPIVFKADKYSFPSGHASRTVLIAMMSVTFRSMGPTYVVTCACLWACLTSMSRVLLGRHYCSDVLAGALIGVAIAAVLSRVRSLLLCPAGCSITA